RAEGAGPCLGGATRRNGEVPVRAQALRGGSSGGLPWDAGRNGRRSQPLLRLRADDGAARPARDIGRSSAHPSQVFHGVPPTVETGPEAAPFLAFLLSDQV